MGDVVRLRDDHGDRVRPSADPYVGPYVGRTELRSASTANSRSASTARFPASDTDSADAVTTSDFVAPGVDRRELRKLKRGDRPASDRLDLHGLAGAEAIDRVTKFVVRARARHRVVCIVHGRGLHSERGVAVLKARVRECLRTLPAVLAFTDAPRADGGDGAVYVLLRR